MNQILNAMPGNVKFRYYGNVEENPDGVIVCASILDRTQMKLHCGISIAPSYAYDAKQDVYNPVKFDKTFSKVVALHRLAAHLGFTRDSKLYTEHIIPSLEACRTRVVKSRTRTRLTQAEYLERRALGPKAGYYDTKVEFYGLDDFRLSKDFMFSLDIGENITHKSLDIKILKRIEELADDNNTTLPSWVLDAVLDLLEEIDVDEGHDPIKDLLSQIEEDSDEETEEDDEEDEDADADADEDDIDEDDEVVEGVEFTSPELMFEGEDDESEKVQDGRCYFGQKHVHNGETVIVTCSPMFENKQAAMSFAYTMGKIVVDANR